MAHTSPTNINQSSEEPIDFQEVSLNVARLVLTSIFVILKYFERYYVWAASHTLKGPQNSAVSLGVSGPDETHQQGTLRYAFRVILDSSFLILSHHLIHA